VNSQTLWPRRPLKPFSTAFINTRFNIVNCLKSKFYDSATGLASDTAQWTGVVKNVFDCSLNRTVSSTIFLYVCYFVIQLDCREHIYHNFFSVVT